MLLFVQDILKLTVYQMNKTKVPELSRVANRTQLVDQELRRTGSVALQKAWYQIPIKREV